MDRAQLLLRYRAVPVRIGAQKYFGRYSFRRAGETRRNLPSRCAMHRRAPWAILQGVALMSSFGFSRVFLTARNHFRGVNSAGGNSIDHNSVLAGWRPVHRACLRELSTDSKGVLSTMEAGPESVSSIFASQNTFSPGKKNEIFRAKRWHQ
jgi:hypothetical protein